jgi:hypothetical protein
MAEYKPIPVHVAKQIADHYEKSQVVIVAVDPVHDLTHTTTYGVSADDKVESALLGDWCAALIGCDVGKRTNYEDFRNDFDAARLKEAVELLAAIHKQKCVRWEQFEQIERLIPSVASVSSVVGNDE